MELIINATKTDTNEVFIQLEGRRGHLLLKLNEYYPFIQAFRDSSISVIVNEYDFAKW